MCHDGRVGMIDKYERDIENLKHELSVMEKLYKESCNAAYDRGELVAEIERLKRIMIGSQEEHGHIDSCIICQKLKKSALCSK